MNRTMRELMLSVFLGVVVPGILLGTLSPKNEPASEPSVETMTVPLQNPGTKTISIQVITADGTVHTSELEDYLLGVVLAEMPASFETEALKAQAVVARTYTMKCIEAGKHGGSVCTDYTCCQAYISPEDYKGSTQDLDKVSTAVLSTAGQVLTYEGSLIEATYFSCSGGMTEDAVAVWGTDYPYLRSVESPGEENAEHYTDTITYTSGNFSDLLGVSLPGMPSNWFGFTTYTAGGGVNTMRIGDTDYRGTELRNLLGLRSTAFSVSVQDDQITITTKGFGHRVGMSQYGADAMAVTGSSYREILAHYYNGTELSLYEN